MNYRKAVAEGRRLLKRSEEDQWALARLTAEVIETGVSQRQWAADLGVSRGHVGTLAALWNRYGDGRGPGRTSGRTFAEYYELAKSSEARAEDLLDRAEESGRSVSTVQRSERYGDKVQTARRLLSDPAVARDALREQSVRATVARASMDVASEQEQEQRAAQAQRAPKAAERARIYDWLGRLTSARRQMWSVLDEVGQSELNDDDRQMLREVAGELEAAVGWLTSYLDSGDRSWDRALHRMLSEES